ncbi:VOC family protein [Mesoflavibacter zeaxanthinifaciens]|uniref:VOC family protein n=1 Tax=Mesoflavibacter zeaxanthinifaciens TaxID=393060 RepID=UPI000485375D|nr:VOC family protein [Mesoflavibacter zeaxanthinifaciens]
MNTISYFEIQSSEPKREIEFYKNVFGWTFTEEKGLPIEYYRIETNGMNGALLKRPAKTPPKEHGTNAFNCSIMVYDFNKTAELIIENGGIVAMEKFPIKNRCWQGYFIDKDNNVFGIFEVDENAE